MHKEKPQSVEKKKANKILRETCCPLADGRYETGHLWAKDSSLPNNEPLAPTHLQNLLARLQRKPKMYNKYDEGIQSDLQNGYLRTLPEE